MIEGETNIAGYEFRVQDEQLMIYVPGDKGNSEPLTPEVVRRLAFITGLANAHLEQIRRKREDGYPYPSRSVPLHKVKS